MAIASKWEYCTMKNFATSFLLFCISAALLSGCSGSEQVVTERPEHGTESHYMSATGSDFLKDEVKKGLESVKRVHNTVAYRTYQFSLDDLPTRRELEEADLMQRSVQTMMDHESKAGSALILSNRGGKTVLITAAHTVTFPDTLWHYTEEGGGNPDDLVEAVSVRQSRTHFVIGSRSIYDFDVAAADPNRDLAFMVRSWESGDRPHLTPLALSVGSSGDLDWTDQVYAIGYPMGMEMVTRAMVSRSMQTERRSFVLDASFNRGFSGGSVFAERADGSGMEWVGMLSSASGGQEEYLVPERDQEREFRPDLEYTGAIYTQRSQRINYGITYAVGIDEVKQFYNENRALLNDQGIRIPILEE